MGGVYSHWFGQFVKPDETPDWRNPPTHDPMLGFPGGREERVMVATQEEMEQASLPLKHRDYCAHKLIAFRQCRDKEFPWVSRCAHQMHDWNHCKFDDMVLRMKEYERERRLLQRNKKKAAREERLAAEELAA